MSAQLNLVLVLLASPFVMFVLNIALHQTLRHLRMPFVAQKTVMFCALAGNAPVLAAAWWFSLRHVADPVELVCGWLFALCVHNAFGCFYFQCFNLSETSLHIHALSEVHLGIEVDEGRNAAEELATGTAEAVAVRLNRLVELGQARREGDRYLATGGIFLYVSKLFDFWRWLIGCSVGARHG